MKTDITRALVDEHRLILRMITLLERNAVATAKGNYTNWQFYRDGVDFIRTYADRHHHAKEENVLFEALVKNGMPREHSPVAAMLMEHDQGRSHVRALEIATLQALAGSPDREAVIAEHALAYAELLREHIAKEDNVLYPLAERLIGDTLREEIIAGYAAAEARTAPEFTAYYEARVEQYENER